MTQETADDVPVIVIKRDHNLHSWVFSSLGAHVTKLPLTDEAEAYLAVNYLKTLMNGRVKVQVDLS